jgi:hypothetical protein
MQAFHVLPLGVSHRFEFHSAFRTFASRHLNQMVSGVHDSFRVIRLTLQLFADRRYNIIDRGSRRND